MTVAEYNSCVDLFSDGVYRFLLKNIKDEEQAKDLVQETYEKLWAKVDEVSFEKAKSYIFTSGYHIMIDWIRKKNHQLNYQKYVKSSLIHTSRNQYSDLQEALNNALDKLPTIQKSVILLRDYEGYSYDEIGKITALSEAQVKVYIYRARIALKNYIVKLENII